MAQMISAGHDHSLILTRSGLIYAFGSNKESQLGIPAKRNSQIPICIQDVSHIPMNNISASNFSASVSQEKGELYIWGTGTFGEFQTPHRVKKVNERVTHLSLGTNFGVALTEGRTMYTWGDNSFGQLGTGDFKSQTGPIKID